MSKSILKGKNILYIGVKFYHYHLEIIQKLNNDYGATVTFFPERDTSIKYGIVNRLFPSYLEKYQEIHYQKILEQIEHQKFDYFLVIRGLKMPLWFVIKVKGFNPKIKTINYQWDSNINRPFINQEDMYNILPEFDAKLSFDYKDVEDYPALKYCPTFYTDEIKQIGVGLKVQEHNYDLFYFGSYLPERYRGLLNFIKFAEQNNYKLKTYFYMPIRYYIIERLKGVKIDRKLIKLKPMNRNDYLKFFKQSKAIVDVSNEKQTGMAMRVIDALGSGKMVLTTNKWIKNDVIFDPNQIFIIDINHIEIPPEFLAKSDTFEPKQEFTIDNFIKRIFLEPFDNNS